MSVHFDPSSSAIRTTGVDTTQRPIPSGLSSAPSTIQSRLAANESEGGICALISRVISQICEAVRRLFSSASSEASTAPTISPLQARIAKGREFIDSLCDDLPSERCAVFMLIKYNEGSEVPCRLLPTGVEREGFKEDCCRQMEALLGRDRYRDCNDGELMISRKVFTKNPDNTINFSHEDLYFRFASENYSQCGGSSPNNDRSRVVRLLGPEILASSPERRQEIADILNGL